MRNTILILSALTLFAAPAGAQIYNGFFDIPAGDGWTVTQPTTGFLYFETAGGNPGPYATVRIAATGPVDVSCISQVFDCGDVPDGICFISVDYSLLSEIYIAGGGHVVISVDSTVLFDSPAVDTPWTTVNLEVPCGVHEIEICLDVREPGEQWVACFDNVTAECDDSVPVEARDWGMIKSLY